MTISHEFHLQEDPKQGKILMKDGNQVFCHKLSPLIMEGSMGSQVGFFRHPCSTNCGRANICVNDKGKWAYVQSCELEPLVLPLKEAEATQPEKSTLRLIQ